MQPLSPDEESTLDAFHRGGFHLIQPKRNGHRAGLDAMFLAAAVPHGFSGRLADLGAGAGAAGFAVAANCPKAEVTLVERAPEMIACARASLKLAQNAELAGRIRVLDADVTLSGRQRAESGLGDRMFDFAVMNPPFNPATDRATPEPLRRLAHVMHEGLFETWLRTAAAIVKPRGGVALIARPSSLDEILSALSGRFGDIEMLALHPRSDAAATRIVLRGRLGARGGLRIRPSLILHGSGHGFSPRAEAICNGQAFLFSD